MRRASVSLLGFILAFSWTFRDLRLIPRSPWNFYQFLSSNVLRSSFLKFPEDPDDPSSLFLYRTFIVFLRDCLPYSSLSLSFSCSFHRSFISYFLPPRSPSCHPPGLYYCLLHARFLHGSIRLSWPLSVLLLFFRVFFLPSPTR